ncbi:MAG: DUF1320 domain-containing protein [bacterium]
MYCTINDLINDITKQVIIELVNDENINPEDINLTTEDNIYTSRITEQINTAEEEINGYILNKVNFPSLAVPKLITIICRDISIYYLYKRRLILNIPDSIKNIYMYRISQLKDIALGKISIPVDQQNSYLENYYAN